MKKPITVLLAVALLGLTALASPQEGSAPRYTSHYRHADRTIDGFDVSQSTTAPLQIVVMARLDVSPATAFDLVSRQLTTWIAQIPHVEWDHASAATAGTCSQGSVRVCEFGKGRVVEHIAFWEDGQVYAYRADPARSTTKFPIKNHLGVFIVESDGQGGALVTWRQYFNRKFSLMAPMVGYGMRTRIMEPGLRKLVTQHGGELVQPAF